MTDKHLLGKGRMYFEGGLLSEPVPDMRQAMNRTWRGTFVTSPFAKHILAKMAVALGQDPVPQLVGYDPQKLLPSPERLKREWHERLLDTFFQADFTNAVLSAYIDFEGPSTLPLPTPMPRFPDVSRWNDPDSTPLEDIQRYLGSMGDRLGEAFEHKAAIISVTGADYAEIEKRIMASIANPSVRCIVLDIDEPGGDFLSPYSHAEMFFPRGMMLDKPEAVETSRGMRDKSYLKHDPSKKHKRRKRK